MCRFNASSTDGTFCDCRSMNSLTCPAQGPQFEAKCCANGGKCQGSCGCKSNGDCPYGSCCTWNPVSNQGICVTNAFNRSGQQQCGNCNDFYGAAGCPETKPFCCGNGRCAANATACGCSSISDCPDGHCCTVNKTCSPTPFVGSKQVCMDCGSFPVKNVQCPADSAPYCCLDGTCAANLTACKCKTNNQCPYNSCCTRQPNSTSMGTCSDTVLRSTTPIRQLCPDCSNMNGLSCPEGRGICCLNGTCVSRASQCPLVTRCPNGDGECPSGSCCNMHTGFCVRSMFSGTRQVCASCGAARDKGLNCSSARPFCCPSGACATSQAACKVLLSGKDVAKYRAFHEMFVDLQANVSMTADDSLFTNGYYNRPDLSQFKDFTPYIVASENGECPGRQDVSIGAHGGAFRGLDFFNAPKTLLAAADAAAQFWLEECSMLKACNASMRADNVTLATFKSWTTLVAQKIYSYLQQTPAGRNLLCPPRNFWGGLWQTFQRVPDPSQPFFGVHNWPSTLNPVNVFIKGPDGKQRPVNLLNIMLKASQVKWYIPEAGFAFEGLVELMIMYDHSLPF